MQVEACIACDSAEVAAASVANALSGGAARVELCRDMSAGGLTPDMHIVAGARESFGERRGVMVMIRPRAGNFEYDESELELMAEQIEAAEAAGADGVVFGVLRRDTVDVEATRRLVDLAHGLDLTVTFHRAFDATHNPVRSLGILLELGVDHLLTGGVPWGSRATVVDGLEMIASLAVRASGEIEIVVGGGVTRVNAGQLRHRLEGSNRRISWHAFSDLLEDGVTDAVRVSALVDAVAD